MLPIVIGRSVSLPTLGKGSMFFVVAVSLLRRGGSLSYSLGEPKGETSLSVAEYRN